MPAGGFLPERMEMSVIACRRYFAFALLDISRKWTVPVWDWKTCLAQFAVYFDDRLSGVIIA